MKDPSDSDAELLGAFDQVLLGSAKADEPPAGAAGRAAAALGGAVVAAAGAAGATTGIAAKSSLLALVTKPFVIGVLGGVVVGGGVFLLRSGRREPAAPAMGPVFPSATGPVGASSVTSNGAGPTPTSSQAPAELTARPAHRRDAEPEHESAVVQAPPEPGPATLGSEASFPPLPSASAAVSGPSSIAAEIQRVDAAREALRSGRPEAALVEIARYRQSAPRGTLATEVSLLEIQAELALGHQELARGKARAFLAEHSGDSYRARVQALFPAGERP